MYHWTKGQDRTKKFLRAMSALFILGSLASVALYFVAPGPFKRIVYKKFLGRKLGLSFSNILTAKHYDSSSSKLSKFHLEIDPKTEDRMYSDVMGFGKDWQRAFLSYSKDRNIPVEVKMRGHKLSQFHFAGIKKSLWVKTKAGVFVNDWRRATFTNFKEPIYFIDGLAYNMANDFGILAPRHEYVDLFINKEFRGVFHLIEAFDKYWVQNEERTSGDVYALDEYENTEDAFLNPKYWRKKSANRKNKKTDNRNIVEALGCVKNLNCELEKIFDIDKFLRHKVFFEWLGTDHADNFHNQVWFMEPSRGKFEPVAWDILVFDAIKEFNQSNNFLEQRLMMNPLYRMRKLELQSEIFEKVNEDYIDKAVDELEQKLEFSMSADRALGNTFPFSFREWKMAVNKIRSGLKKRRSDLLEDAKNEFEITLVKNEQDKLILGLDLIGTIILTDWDGPQKITVNKESLRKGQRLEIGNYWSEKNSTYETPHGIVPNTKISKDLSLIELQGRNINSLSFLNPATGKRIVVEIGNLKKYNSTHTALSSIKLLPRPSETTIVWGPGKKIIGENFILEFGKELIVKPGTTLLFKKDVSLYAFGKVSLNGSKEAPIVIKGFRDEVWGSFSLNGNGANGSIFNHIEIGGGKDSTFRGVFYSGMLNCYHAECYVTNSVFLKNYGDDALNFKSINKGIVRHNLFYKTAFDAIDLDFSSVEVHQNIIFKTGNDGVDLGTGHARIFDNIIYFSGDKGISAGERSHPIIHNNYIVGNNIGIAAKDKSEFFVFNNYFSKNNIMFSAYQKKSAFGGSHPIVFNNVTFDNEKAIDKDPQSTIEEFNNVEVEISNFDTFRFDPDFPIAFLDALDFRLRKTFDNLKKAKTIWNPSLKLSRWEEFVNLKEREESEVSTL